MKTTFLRIITFFQQKERHIIIALATFLILLGLAYSFYLGDRFRYPDERDYYSLAINLSTNHTYTLDGQSPTAIRPPGYPFILALLSFFSSSVIFLRFANFVALGISICLLYRLLKAQAHVTAAIAGAFLVFGYPVLIYTAGTLYPQTIAACLLLGVVYLASKTSPSVYTSVGLGLLFGYLILTIPTFAAILIVFLIWMLFTDKRHKYHAAVVAIAAVLTITPWTIRNYLTFRSFVFISSNSGLNLLLGNSENTTPDGGVTVDITKYDAVAGNLNEIDRNAYYTSRAVAFITTHKLHSAKLYLLKLLHYFHFQNELRTSAEASRLGDLVMLVSYGVIVSLALLRIAMARRYRLSRLERLILLLYIANALVTALFFTRIRFRLPFDLLLIIVAATLIGRLIEARLAQPALPWYTTPSL